MSESPSLTERELCAWARVVGRLAAAGGRFVCLYGELGAGKSTLVRAALRGAGVEGSIPSPTFTLINRHVGRQGTALYHADLYRLRDPAELTDIGWSELLDTGRAVFVEWADRVPAQLPTERWDIHLSFVSDPERRRLKSRAVGNAPALPSVAESEQC